MDPSICVPSESQPPAISSAPEFLRPAADYGGSSRRIEQSGRLVARVNSWGMEGRHSARTSNPKRETKKNNRAGLFPRAFAQRNRRADERIAAQRSALLLSWASGITEVSADPT